MLKIFSLLIIIFQVAQSNKRNKCDGEWVPGNDENTCYHVSDAQMSWHMAQEYCGLLGGYMVEINTLSEQLFLENILGSNEYYWIGLSDLAHTGTWSWQHSWSEATWTHWADGEPDGGTQHCAMVWGGHGYYWADLECTNDSTSSGHGIFALCELGPGPDPQLSHSVLWLGNSYTWRNDVPSIVERLAAADGINLDWDSHAQSSWTWKLHATSQETLDKIRSKQWDTVILQEQSTRPAYPAETVCQESVPYLDILAEEIRNNNPNTMIQFYLTWGRPHGDQEKCNDDELSQFCDFESMQNALTKTYLDFGCLKAKSTVAPVGESFRYIHGSQTQEVFLSLYNDGGDDHHASEAGSYLSAATHFAAMFNKSVLGNSETMGLNQDMVTMLQTAASETWFRENWIIEDGCYQCLCCEAEDEIFENLISTL